MPYRKSCTLNLVNRKRWHELILRFIGQMLTSAMIDYIYLDIFSKGKVIGGLLFLIGLIINANVRFEIKVICFMDGKS